MPRRSAALIRELVELSVSSRTVSEYYRAAVDALASAVGFDNAIVFSPRIVDGRPFVYGMHPEALSIVSTFLEHFDRYGAVPTRAAALAAKHEVVIDEQVYADLKTSRARDPFENDIARPCRVSSVMDLAIRLGPNVFGFISMHRTGRGRRFSAEDSDLLRPVAPALGVTVAALHSRCDEPRFDGLLTPRESQIAALVHRGLSNKEIATTLGSSPHTVRNQLHGIFEKLSISRRAELMRMAPSAGKRVSGRSG